MLDYDVLDEALVAMNGAGPELRNGFTNHAPMAIEALCTMGRADAVARWFERYRTGLIPGPPRVQRVLRDAWRPALAHPERFSDWRELMAEELREAPWPIVLDRWVARLAPGIAAAATHGVIRVGHAVRALERAATPARLTELAEGLAYWAATYQTLPTREAPQVRPEEPRAALEQVPIVPSAQRTFAGSITSSFAALEHTPTFADAINRLRHDADLAVTVSRLTETFTRVYLANARDALTTIVFIHGVTSAAAVRALLPHLDPATAHAALRYVWQAECALYATFATAAPPALVGEPREDSAAALFEVAVANGDEHVIKFTEVCLREDAIRPSPAYRVAARHAMTVLGTNAA